MPSDAIVGMPVIPATKHSRARLHRRLAVRDGKMITMPVVFWFDVRHTRGDRPLCEFDGRRVWEFKGYDDDAE